MMAQPYVGDVVPGTAPSEVQGPKPYDGPVMPTQPYQGPVSPQQSPLAAAPPQAPQQQAQGQVSPSIMDAINRPADRTVELMGQSVQDTFKSIKTLATHPSVKSATNAALNVIGLPFSPITSVVDAFAGDPAVQLAHSLGASPKADPYIRAAVQTVVPAVGSKSKMLQQALGAEGSFLTGALTPGSPPLKPGQSAANIADTLIKHDQQSIARDVQLKKSFRDFISANPDYKQYDEEIYHSAEDPTRALSPGAAFYKKTYIDPMRRRNDLYVKELESLGVTVKDKVDPATYIHRQAIQPVEHGVIGAMGDIVDPTGALTNMAPTKGFGTHPDSLMKPNAGVAQSSITGERGGYVIDPATNTVDVYKNGKVIDKGTVSKDTITTSNGGQWDMERGTTLEVQQHTPIRYQNSAMASVIETQRELRDAIANAKTMQGMKTSPEFQQLARPPGSTTPKEWKEVTIPGYHGLDGWKMDPHLQEVLHDYTGTQMPINNLLQGVNRIMQGSIFINPMGHILNVEMHAAVEAGLFGGVARMIDGTVKAITPGEKTLTRRAIESVINKDADYLRYVKESPGLKGANNYIRNFGNDVLKEMGKNPQQLAPIAQKLGYANPAAMLRSVYAASNKTLWGVGDMILMKSFLAKEGELGASTAEVAKDVGKHIPTYVIPSRVMGSRSLATILKSPYALGFSRYEYNRLESYANLMKGVITPGPGGRVEAMDQIAALVFHAAVTYPMVDYAIQQSTGNPRAQLRGFGPFLFTENINSYGRGEKNAAQAMVQPIARPSAAVETATDLYRNKDWADRPIYGHGGKFAAYVASKTYPTQAIYRMLNPPKGVNKKQAIAQFALDQLGIKAPTAQQEAIIHKFAQRELQKRKTDKP